MEEKLVWLEEQKKEYMRKLLKDKDGSLIDLSAVQEQIEQATRKIAHFTKGEREKIMRQTPEDVKIREEAAARCKRVMERRVLSKQARRARAHLVKCSMESGRKKNRRKALLELFVDGTFTDNREEWQKELKRSHFSPTVCSAAMAKAISTRFRRSTSHSEIKTYDESYCEDAIVRVVFNFSSPGEEILRKTRSLEVRCCRR